MTPKQAVVIAAIAAIAGACVVAGVALLAPLGCALITAGVWVTASAGFVLFYEGKP